MKSYRHIAAAVLERPWAIRPEKLRVIVSILEERIAGVEISAEEVAERIGAAPARRPPARAGGLAVLPLQGVIMQRAGMMAQSSGAVSLESWMADFRALMADEEIGTIVLDIDSPGGEVTGVPEAAAELRAARDQKRIVAVANPTAASAAYWLGAQAGEFVVTPSGWVGSIGIYSLHEDISGFLENEGIKPTYISAGKYKVEGNESEPLGDAARAYRQSIVDDYYGMFVGDVAKGRAVTPAVVRGGMGEGRMVLAKGAKAENMVDGVSTLDDAVRKALGVPKQAPAARVLDVNGLAPAGLFGEGPEPVRDDPDDEGDRRPVSDPAIGDGNADDSDSDAELELYQLRARAHGRAVRRR